MADYIAIHRNSGKQFLVRRADSSGHAHQMFDENVIGESSASYEFLALNAGSVAPIPEYTPPDESTPEPTPPLPETDNPFSGSPAG